MIPILYSETDPSFTSNGLGRLAECTSCRVTEARNGEYECEFTYPITGKLYTYIKEGRYVSCTHDDKRDQQLFKIYRRSAPINGLVTFSAHHRSYELNNVIINPPMTATSAADAFTLMGTGTTPANPYTMWTDVTTAGTFTQDVPISVRAALGGSRGSVLDVFGGEYEWDDMIVKLHASRGVTSGITIRYGKNLTDITQVYDELDIYDGVYPYWYQEDGGLVILPEKYVARSGVTNPVIRALDLTNEFDEVPTVEQLRTRASSWLNSNQPWIPKNSIKIKFAQLWQTEEYKDVAILQRLSLCDRVNVYYAALGIEAEDIEVIKVVYNVLLDRYDEMELGDARSSFAETLLGPIDAAIEEATSNLPSKSYLDAAIDHATDLITGGMGGHIVFLFDADGKPTDMLVMDTEDVGTAQHVLRINVNGIGFSSTGINGPYSTAWTLDGAFAANFITSGTMSANRIRGGTLALGGSTVEGSFGNGSLKVYDADNYLIFDIQRLGLIHYSNAYSDVETRTWFHTGKIDGYERAYGTTAWTFIGRLNLNARVIHTSIDGSQNTHDCIDLQTTGAHPIFIHSDNHDVYINANKIIEVTSGQKLWLTGKEVNLAATNGDIAIGTTSSHDIWLSGDHVYANGYQVVGSMPKVGSSDGNTAIRDIYYADGSSAGSVSIPAMFYFELRNNSLYGIAVDTTSDRKLKRNITGSTVSALEAIKQIEFYSFDFIEDGTHRDLGYIAQQLEKIIPIAVYNTPDKLDDKRNPISTTKHINTYEMVVYATKAIKELSEIVDEQRQTIESLQARIDKLESLVNKIIGD